MRKKIVLFLFLFCSIITSAQHKVTVSSPDRKLRFSLQVTPEDLSYEVDYKKQSIITNSLLGFDFDSGEFCSNLLVGKVRRKSIDETYKLLVGKVSIARNHCNEAVIPLQEPTTDRRINLIVRVFNDGVAFRYEFPEQKGWNSYVMYDEKTQFNLSSNPKTLLMYLPGYANTHESVYEHVAYNEITEQRLIEMPVTFEFGNKIFVYVIMQACI